MIQRLQNEAVLLEPATEANVDLLVRWTLDPVAQGPYKRVPEMGAAQLRELFLRDRSREYFLIRLLSDGSPVGRLYWRAWCFTSDANLTVRLRAACLPTPPWRTTRNDGLCRRPVFTNWDHFRIRAIRFRFWTESGWCTRSQAEAAAG